MRVLPKLGKEIVEQIEGAWRLPQPDWARKRLLVVRLIAQHEHTVAEIMKIAGVCRQSVFTYRDKVVAEGLEGLLKRDWAGARVPTVRGAVADEFLKRLEEGKFRQARDAQAWIKKRTRKTLTESGVRQIIRRLGGKLKVPRKSHVKKDTKAAQEFRGKSTSLQTASATWAKTDPVGAAQWAANIEPPLARDTAIGQIFNIWSSTDPMLASGAINALPLGSAKTEATSAVAKNFIIGNPDAALKWAGGTQARSKRLQYVRL
jgi:transposase